MAHFAQLDNNNIVLQVIVVNNDILLNNGIEYESIGIDFCKQIFGIDTIWIKTSYNVSIRYNFAGIGYTYDAINDAFIPPKPYPSWILDTTVYRWKSTIDYPIDGLSYYWDESTLSWILYVME